MVKKGEHAALFQFTPLREGRHVAVGLRLECELFQFTPLREGRRPAPSADQHHQPFQFTPLREGRLDLFYALRAPYRNFNSRPSARGDALRAGGRGFAVISIHAPPRGATGSHRGAAEALPISIHAPPRGATQHHQPTSSRPAISIHAPPRGATLQVETYIVHACLFQFTPLREGRRRCQQNVC